MMKNNIAKLVIIDDDPDFYNILTIYLRKIGITHISVGNDFQSGKELIDTEKPDLVLLDIDLKSTQSGVDMGIYIRDKFPNVPIIYFTNNFTEAVFEAVKYIQPNAFLDKQLSELKVRQAVELALTQEVQSIEAKPPPQYCYFAKEFIFVKVGNVFKKIDLKDIDYIFYADRYANLQFEGKRYPVNIPMKNLAESLPEIFMQIHQSYIVNLSKIQQVNINDNQVEIAGKWMPVGISFRKALRDKLTFLT